MSRITGRMTSFLPSPLSVLQAGVPENISTQAEGQLSENGSGGEPALYELTLTLSTDEMTTRQSESFISWTWWRQRVESSFMIEAFRLSRRVADQTRSLSLGRSRAIVQKVQLR